MDHTEAQKKLEKQIALKTENEKNLERMKSGSDAELLLNWKSLEFPQPAPSQVQVLKDKTGLSWKKFRAFIDSL